MSTLTMSVVSRRWVRCKVTGTLDDVAVDPDTITCEFALLEVSEVPVELDWEDGSWQEVGTLLYARVLVGADTDLERAVGTWALWCRVNGSVERPAEQVGTITVY